MKASKVVKRLHQKSKSSLSLKEFVRHLVSKGDEQATAWFVNKTAAPQAEEKAERRSRKGSQIAAMRAARVAQRDKGKKKN